MNVMVRGLLQGQETLESKPTILVGVIPVSSKLVFWGLPHQGQCKFDLQLLSQCGRIHAIVKADPSHGWGACCQGVSNQETGTVIGSDTVRGSVLQ